MNYRFDPELALAVPFLPQLDFSDVAVARATITAMSAQMPAPDASAVHIESRRIEGPDGPVPVRIYRPLAQQGAVAVSREVIAYMITPNRPGTKK